MKRVTLDETWSDPALRAQVRAEGRQRLWMPRTPHRCPKQCVYAVAGVCDDPRINKGNGDAYCHRRGNREVLSWLVQIAAADGSTQQTMETQDER